MSEMIDLEKLYRQEQQRWLREEAPRHSFRDILTGSVPYWIVLVALVLYGLSAPHTAGVFDKLTPEWGFIAPIGVEFGLLYAAFRVAIFCTGLGRPPGLYYLLCLDPILFPSNMLQQNMRNFFNTINRNCAYNVDC
jgi:hypothetical protein